MADDQLTIADLVGNTFDISSAEVSDLLEDAPLVSRLPVQMSSKGDTHKYVKVTQSPVVNFRAENAGRDFDHSVTSLVTVTLKVLDYSWRVDKSNADVWLKAPQDLIATEGKRHLAAALFHLEKQIISGTGADSGGFAGLADDGGLNAVADTMVVDGGGTGSDTTSVYAMRVGEEDVSLVMRGDVPMSLGETTVIDALDGSNKHYPAYYTPACTWAGLQIGSAYSAGRIANCETAGSSNIITDDKIYDLIAKFPAGRKPNLLVMNRTSQELLRGGRTATNATGAPAPIPEFVGGIPILVTDAITDTEAAIS